MMPPVRLNACTAPEYVMISFEFDMVLCKRCN
jgi:hypothetical protein